jgi:hypothetical protein
MYGPTCLSLLSIVNSHGSFRTRTRVHYTALTVSVINMIKLLKHTNLLRSYHLTYTVMTPKDWRNFSKPNKKCRKLKPAP